MGAMLATLPPTRTYYPFADGKYAVTARMRLLGDEPHFQVDRHYLAYVGDKAANRRAARGRYYLRDGLSPALETAIVTHVAEGLARNAPEAFQLRRDGDRATLTNALLGLTLDLDLAASLVVGERRGPAALSGGEAVFADLDFEGLDAFEAIALQTQEDWAALERDAATGLDRTTALHVSFPSHWRPEDKIGRSFMEVHRPVAGGEILQKAAASLVETMVYKGPWERFTWTIPRWRHLDEHLDVVAARPHPGVPAVDDVGDASWLRVERQVVQGFPAEAGSLFTIRLHLVPVREIAADPAMARALASAVRSHSPASLVYKQLGDWHEPLLAYLDRAALSGPGAPSP